MSDNPQAFPCLDDSGCGLSMRDPGMTLRDYFAAQAFGSLVQMVMPGLTNNPAFPTDEIAFVMLAKKAYSAADSLLEERSK